MNTKAKAMEIIKKVGEKGEMITAKMHQGKIELEIIGEVTHAQAIEKNEFAYEINQDNTGQFLVSDFLENDFELAMPAIKSEWEKDIFEGIVCLYSENY